METVEKTWKEILPLYEKLHTVVRHGLQRIYGTTLIKSDGAIPAHLGTALNFRVSMLTAIKLFFSKNFSFKDFQKSFARKEYRKFIRRKISFFSIIKLKISVEKIKKKHQNSRFQEKLQYSFLSLIV